MTAAAKFSPLNLHTAEGMLSFIDGSDDRETWVAVGMALKCEFSDAAFDAWDRWSQAAANYSAPAVRSSWRGFKSRAGGYTIGTLIKLAKDGGYTFDANEQPQVSAQELARRRLEHATRVARDTAARAVQESNAEQKAVVAWRNALREGTSSYAVRKGIDAPESCRFLPAAQGGGLVIPMLRYDLPREQALKGVQTIFDNPRDPAKTKLFTYGMAKTGASCRLGLAVVGEPVFVCEGYATGMTIRMALARRYPVFVAFDAHSLPPVVDAIHRALPGSPIVICADDDYTRKSREGLVDNVGRIQAQVAMDSVMDAGARLVTRTYPVFRKETPRTAKDSDFNDLHRLEGLAEVSSQLQLCLDIITELKNYG